MVHAQIVTLQLQNSKYKSNPGIRILISHSAVDAPSCARVASDKDNY